MNSISIWNDKIILNWDGVIPPIAPNNSVKCPDDVVYFWPHLLGHARWSKRSAGFMLDFSKQNIMRIQAQLGQVPVKSGNDRITELHQKNNLMVDMIHKSMKVKEFPIDRLPTYEYKMNPLGDYQHRGVILMTNVKRFPLFADCGMGKTFMVLVSTERQIKLGLIKPGKTLVVAKLNTIETGWLEDAAKFTNLKIESLWLPSSKYKRREKIVEKMKADADVFVINHEGLLAFEDELTEMKYDKVVVDESTILKGFHGMHAAIKGGQFGRSLLRVATSADWRVVMSGTPAPNGPQDLWGQFYFLDPDGLLLESSFRDFQQEFMEIVDMRRADKRFRINKATGEFITTDDGKRILIPLKPGDPMKWVPKKDTTDKISKIINPLAYRLKIRDHIKDLPELTQIKRTVTMDAEQAKHYKDMEERLKIELGDTRITVPVKIAQLMKLRQVTGGFVIDNNEVAHALPVNPKMEMLDSLLNDEIDREDKVIIYAEYQWEIRTIIDRYKDHGIVSVFGGNTSVKNLESIRRFKEDPKVRIVVLHPKSAAHGITFTNAHYMIFYSFSHSAEDSYQCIKRIERAGQKHPMFVYHLIANKTVDVDIYKVIEVKNQNQSELLDSDQLLFNLWRQQNEKQ